MKELLSRDYAQWRRKRSARIARDRRYSIRDTWYSSMKPPFRRRSRASMAGRHRVSGSYKRCCTGTGKVYIHRSVATQPRYRALCVRRRNEWRDIQGLCQQFLAPTLKRGDIVFMDNVSVHKVDGVEEAIEARGAIPFYLPAYSPDFNPIEQLFSKLKAMLRKIAAYSLKNSASQLTACARPSPLACARSLGLSALHSSPTQAMVSLIGKRSSRGDSVSLVLTPLRRFGPTPAACAPGLAAAYWRVRGDSQSPVGFLGSRAPDNRRMALSRKDSMRYWTVAQYRPLRDRHCTDKGRYFSPGQYIADRSRYWP